MAVYGGLWAIMEHYGAVSGLFGRSCPLDGRFMDGWRVVWAVLRASGRGCAPTIFRARPIPVRLPPHSVRR